MHYIDLQQPNGNWLHINAAQIAYISQGYNGNTVIHINGSSLVVKESLDVVKEKLREHTGVTIP